MTNSKIIWFNKNKDTIKSKTPPTKPSFDESILENEERIRIDSIVWEYYSKTGGIYDTLKKLESAVEKPAINAFDFDEEENTYIIFITVTNSILYLFKDFCVSMDKELNSETDESIETEFETLKKEFENIKKLYDVIQSLAKNINADIINYESAMSEDTSKGKKDNQNLKYVLGRIRGIINNFDKSALDNRKINDALETISNELRNLQPNGNSLPTIRFLSSSSNRTKNFESQNENLELDLENKIKKINKKYSDYQKQLDNYNAKKENYDSKYENLKSYVSKYESLRETIDGLYSSINEGGELYCLNNAPSKEDGTDAYMEAAKTLCERAKKITKDYQL